MSAGGKRKATRCREISAGNLRHNQADRRRDDGFLDSPECISELARGESEAASFIATEPDERAVTHLTPIKAGLRDPEDRARPIFGCCKHEARGRGMVTMRVFDDFMQAVGAEPEREIDRGGGARAADPATCSEGSDQGS